MSLPQPNPARPEAFAPIFQDSNFVRADILRNNNVAIFEDLEWLDAESHTPKPTLISADKIEIINSENGNEYSTIAPNTFRTYFELIFSFAQVFAASNWNNLSIDNSIAWLAVAAGNDLLVAVANSGSTRTATSNDNGITWVNQTDPSNSWVSIAFGLGIFVAVGSSIATSSNGVSWTSRHPIGVDGPYQNIVFGNGIFVAVRSFSSTNLYIATSVDGVTWVDRVAPFGGSKIIFGNGIFIVVISNSQVIISLDNAQTWTVQTPPITVTDQLSITFGDNIFLLATFSGTPRFLKSADGVNWVSTSAPGSAVVTDITFGGRVFVGINTFTKKVYISYDDGHTWRENLPIDNLIDVTFARIFFTGKKFILLGSNNSLRGAYSLNIGES